MKKLVIAQLFVAALLASTNCHAQSDLLNSLKEKVSSAVSSITGTSSISLEGTWNYTGSAVQLESDNVVASLGGSVATSSIESKLDEQLEKVGITEGQMSYTFSSDSTFTAKTGSKSSSGTYSYNASSKTLTLKFSKIISLKATLNYSSSSIDLLFDADKLLKLITLLSSKSSNSTLSTISSLSENYDGMLMGFALKKE